jgi:hypothetical protein
MKNHPFPRILTFLLAASLLVFALPAAADDSADESLVPLVCFAPGTSTETVDAHHKRFQDSRLRTSLVPPADKFNFPDSNRWTTTATNPGPLSQGDPTVLTWSIVPDGTSIYGYAGEPTSASNLQAWLNGIYGSPAVWLPLFEQIFDVWGELTGVTYVYEPNDDGSAWTAFTIAPGVLGVRGDLRIAGHTIDGNSNVLAYNFFPNFGDMVIDTADNTYNNLSNNSLVLRNVLAHEHGHGLGIEHVCPVNQTKLMESFLSLAFDGPQFDDILAANRGYGDNSEGNDTSGTAASVGSITPATTFTQDLASIDDDLDDDYYAFSTSGGQQVSIAASPLGSPYLSGPQLSSGACTAGTSYNPADNQDLLIRLLDTNGTTVLGSVNANPAGSGETLGTITLPGAGTYFVNINGGFTNEAQLYSYSIQVDPVPGGYILAVSPGTAGMVNNFTTTGGLPGANTFFLYGFTPGSVAVPGCPGASVGMADVNILETVAADASGTANATPLFIPGGLSGVTVLLQAVELSTCTVSNLVVNTF